VKILSWQQSGFSVDNSVPIPASSRKARMNLSQYIVRHPVSLQKILYARSNATIIYKTKYNEYWKENIKLFKADDLIAELTQHIPPKHKHLIRCYGLYSSRTEGKANKDGSLAKYGYRAKPKKTTGRGLFRKSMRWIRCAGMHKCRRSQEGEQSEEVPRVRMAADL
jgi:hypothetical protein